MQRKKKTIIKDTRVRYKKLTGGTHYLANGDQVKQGQTFKAYPHEIPALLKDDFKCLDDLPASGDFGVSIGLKQLANGKYNVVNKNNGDVLNDKPLTAAEARLFVENDGEMDDSEEVEEDSDFDEDDELDED